MAWRSLGLELPDAAALGENFTVAGLLETEVHLGDVFDVGTAVVQVCQPRTPCYKLAARFGRKDMPVLVQDTGYTGYLLRVLTEDVVEADDDMVLAHRDNYHAVTVAPGWSEAELGIDTARLFLPPDDQSHNVGA